MTGDELSTPLGQTKAPRRNWRLPVSLMQVVGSLASLFLLTFAGFALFAENPFGGEPRVRLALRDAAVPTPPPLPASTPVPTATAPAAERVRVSPPASGPVAGPGQRTVTIIDGSSGARQEVIVAEKDEPATGTASSGINEQLLERSKHGLIPVSNGGMKPFTAYAEADDALRARAAAMPVVAIVVGGLGIGAAKTADAIVKLPPAVTLAFTPYGSDPAKLVERARAQHHEVLLQVPMEPFDFPDNDPGPQTLLTGVGSEQNLDRFTWHMARFQGYVGITNFMGERFVGSEVALQPVLRDAARRGLGFLDDGRAARSVAGPLAESQGMPSAKADLTVDAIPSAAEIDRALARLEAIARERGSAIGMASALPVSIERLGAWAKQLETRGILLVPLTTAMLKPKMG